MRTKFVLTALGAIVSLLSVSASAQSTAITNARIVTVSGAAIDRGTVVIRDGLIESVGADVKAPADAIIIDGTGLVVYPGFIDGMTNLGIATPARPQGGSGGGPSAAQQAPASNSNYPEGLRPEEHAVEDLKAGDSQFEAARNAGFTSALATGRTGIFNGQSVLYNLAGENVSAMAVKTPVALHISFATIPGQYPGSLLGTFSALRQMFYDAQRLRANQKEYNSNPRGMPRPPADRSLEALYPALDGEMPVVFNASSEKEIIRALDLAKEFGLKPIIAGGLEAGSVTDSLKAANAVVLLSLNLPKRTAAAAPEAEPETLEVLRARAEAPKTAAKLAAAGVKFGFQSGAITNLSDLAGNLEKVVEAGLAADAAVRAMTLANAEILGVSDRLGSIEKGKIANLIVANGDITKKDRKISHVFVDGKHFEVKAPPARPAGQAGTAAPAAAMTGTYNITIQAPGQSMTGTLNLQQQAAILTGTMVTELGTAQVRDGRVTGNNFRFETTVVFGGASMDITVSGTLAGSEITGTIDTPQGAVPFSGTKVP